ncbi:uncharacterized protein PV09_05527 [Verruconis gallopava]|uniref:Integral membrane protein n=1 Tax=Verruconis gallopava TaxID=253628 RepID=A0A0D1XLK9_9PEZI|nr:uncharacterized protein PV09_05527 [Verruconis gallopava]KIW03316.1 hypothetical protein PV09_05527 [Verruconis gallopava]
MALHSVVTTLFSMNRRTSSLFILALLANLVAAQVGTLLDPSKLPKCAFSCQTLVSAAQLCVPPIAPVQSQAIYQTCFCNSNYLVNYKAGGVSPTCDDACSSESDRKEIQQWYVKLCSSGAVVTPQGNQVNALATQTTTSSGATATADSSTSSNSGTQGPKSWISTHYQWIILVIVLLLASIAAVFGGIWLKRRQARKWATGGYARDSMLRAQDIANSLSNPHPEMGMTGTQQAQIPSSGSNAYLDGSRERLTMSGANPKRPASARVNELSR